MKAIVLMFDSLNRRCLPPYGGTVRAPHFERLAQQSLVFDTSYVASMPCMPARRDLLTGRPNFLHRSWGPIEPFDDCFTECLSRAGISTHLLTDHYHYLEDGGATYHPRYDTAELFRGQEGDPWKGQAPEPVIPDHRNGKGRRQDWVNRGFVNTLSDFSQTQTMDAGLEFIDRNAASENWYLQIEMFDPHEPFFSHPDFQKGYGINPDEPLFDWPPYGPVTESAELVRQAQARYAALVSQCDASLGRLLEAMDRHEMWQDTLLVVWTDHGYLLGEHGWWAKIVPPLYEEVARTPCFIWDPRTRATGRRSALIQPAIDLAPTLLGFFGQPAGPHMLGQNLEPVVADDRPVRQYAIFGYHGQEVNVTDGRYVYMRAPVHPDNQPLCNYTLMPTQMRGFLPIEQLRKATLDSGFSFTKDLPVLRIPSQNPRFSTGGPGENLLFDLAQDPQQNTPVDDALTEEALIKAMVDLMEQTEAPSEQFERLGLRLTSFAP
jgi:arylsulfatase A-like enzyme